MVTILDGGMGGEIQKRMDGAGKGLWSAKALMEEPEIVVGLHQEYIEAGARMIITNTYSTVPSYLAKAGLESDFEHFTTLGAELAREAVNRSQESVQVAGSLPPLSESYRPDLVPSHDEATPVYAALVQALDPFVDLYLCETMSTADEAFNAASQAKQLGGGKPVYVAWTLDEAPGKGLRSGESVVSAFERVAPLGIDGFLFNCTTPEAAISAIETLSALTDKPLGCYVNRIKEVPEGWTLDNERASVRRTDLTQDYFVELSMQAVDAGASIIGGCCGIGPEDIRAFSEAVSSGA